MLDAPVRRVLAPSLDAAAGALARLGVSPLALTGLGWVVGVGAVLSAGTGHWTLALVLWLGNRILDGLDGAVARRGRPTDLGGFLDIVADFSIYVGFVVAVGIERPEARVACLALVAAYYISGTAFLALSSILERRGDQPALGDGRSLLFVGGLAEGTETVLAYAAFCLMPQHAEQIAWIFAAAVALTAAQRIGFGVLTLRHPIVDPVLDAQTRTIEENV